MTDLLPCPFCGGAAEQTESGAVMCGNTECITICGVPSNGFRKDHDPVALWNTRGVAQAERQPLAIENDQLRKTIQLHAGDAMSLSGELDEWRERALAAEEALALSSTERKSPDYGYCTCGRHASDQCDFCKRHVDGGALSSTELSPTENAREGQS